MSVMIVNSAFCVTQMMPHKRLDMLVGLWYNGMEKEVIMSEFEQYEHHNRVVWVREDLKGKHREHCLCFSCQWFAIDDPKLSCPLANLVYALCVAHDMVLPVWECPLFAKLPQWAA